MSASFRRSAVAIGLAAALLALVPLFTGSFVLHVLTIAFYYVILAASWNLLAGYTGQFSFGHAAFFGIGAYTSTLLFLQLGFTVAATVNSQWPSISANLWWPWVVLGSLIVLWAGYRGIRFSARLGLGRVDDCLHRRRPRAALRGRQKGASSLWS